MAEAVESPDGEPIWGPAHSTPPARSSVVPRQRPMSAEIDARLAVMREVDMRLKSFRLLRWPKTNPVHPQLLASAGFYFEGTGDTVRCAYCAGRLNDWRSGDDPMREHANNFPHCSFVLAHSQSVNSDDYGTAPSSSYSTSTSSTHSTTASEEGRRHDVLREFGIFAHDCSKRLDYAVYQTRLESFSGWPEDRRQRPAELAKAGFFYAGFDDNVKCFCCNGGLRNWRPEDGVVAEHLKWFPRCDFARLCSASMGTENRRLPPTLSPNRRDLQPHRTMAYLQRMGVDTSADQIHRCTELGVASELVVDAITSNGFNLFESAEPLLARIVRLNHERPISAELLESDSHTCKICMDSEVSAVLLPCGHLCCCALCAPPLANCPICRVDVKGFVRAFLS